MKNIDFSEEALTKIFVKKLSSIPDYKLCSDIIKKNTTGKIWLVGGIVSRLLIEELYNIPQKEFDFDFLVEEVNENIILPKGWILKQKYHGNPTFIKDNLEIDIFPIKTHNYISSNNLSPTIDNFFKGVPYTIQAMAFDIEKQIIVGETGIDALQKREYRVNNMQEARKMAERKGISVNDRITAKAKSLGLQPILEEEHL